MAEIVISEFMAEEAVARLRQRFSVAYDPGLVDRRSELVAELAEARALIVRNRTQVDEELLAAAPALQIVGRLGVGLDNIDQDACARRGVAVAPATGANATAVAEYVMTAAALLLRGAYGATDRVLAGEWPRAALSGGGELQGRRLGLLGFGTIARAVADRARPWGLAVLAHDPALAEADPAWAARGVEPAGRDAVLEQADILSLHIPRVPETENLLDAARLAQMKPGAVLINTARGGIVDEAALAEALHAGRLAGAALDVFRDEPLPAGSPLAGAPNLIATPHIAGVTQESNQRISALIAERVETALGAEAVP